MSDERPKVQGMGYYQDLLKDMLEDELEREKVDEINRMLAANVELWNARNRDGATEEEIADAEVKAQNATNSANAVLTEIKRRATEEGLIPTREEMEETLNHGRRAEIDRMIDMGGHITDLLSSARAMMLNLASALPTEEIYDPRPDKSYNYIQSNAASAADLLVEAWEKSKNSLALVKSALRYVYNTKEAIPQTPPAHDPDDEWDGDNDDEDDGIPF